MKTEFTERELVYWCEILRAKWQFRVQRNFIEERLGKGAVVEVAERLKRYEAGGQ